MTWDGGERRRGTPSTGLDRGRSSGLDGLRALACLLVVAFHMHTVSGVSFGPLDPIIRGGDTGVWIFFALSGYLLYKPFVKGGVDLTAYGLKRAGRILPGYLVALAALTVLTGSRLPWEHPLPYLTITAPYDIPLRQFLGNAWTLSAEILFYVTLPFIARFAAGREVKTLAILALASTTLATVHRFQLTDANAWMLGTYPLSFYAFVPGMLLAVLEVRRPAWFAALRSPVALAIGIAYLVFGALFTILPVAIGPAIGTPLVMGWLLHHRLPWQRLLIFTGGASYAMYLWHKDLFIAFGPWFGLLIAIAGSAASWAFIERPILARVHAHSARRAASRSAAAAAAAQSTEPAESTAPAPAA
ncbi:MAG TPA: acyltransferase [Candidatus Binatia bacterium]|nr:acyltransferase [Candidatus Binatia bacterium]